MLGRAKHLGRLDRRMPRRSTVAAMHGGLS